MNLGINPATCYFPQANFVDMRSITSSEFQVLQQLVFIESFDTVQNETGLSYGELRDDLINLLSVGMVEVYSDKEEHAYIKRTYFDSDHPNRYYYRATKTGLDALKTYRP